LSDERPTSKLFRKFFEADFRVAQNALECFGYKVPMIWHSDAKAALAHADM